MRTVLGGSGPLGPLGPHPLGVLEIVLQVISMLFSELALGSALVQLRTLSSIQALIMEFPCQKWHFL